MKQMIIAIRGVVEDETKAHQILSYIDQVIADHPNLNLTASCELKTPITNEPEP